MEIKKVISKICNRSLGAEREELGGLKASEKKG